MCRLGAGEITPAPTTDQLNRTPTENVLKTPAFLPLRMATARPALLVWTVQAPAVDLPTQKDNGLQSALPSDCVLDDVTITPEGHVPICSRGVNRPGIGAASYILLGKPALTVLDLKPGDTRRVLDGDPFTTEEQSTSANGRFLLDDSCEEPRVRTDRLAILFGDRHFNNQPRSELMIHMATHRRNDSMLPTALPGSDAVQINRPGLPWTPGTEQNLTPDFTGGKQEPALSGVEPQAANQSQTQARPSLVTPMASMFA